MAFILNNYVSLSFVLFIFSKEYLLIDEEFLVGLCLVIAFLVINDLGKKSLEEFTETRTASVLKYYNALFTMQRDFRLDLSNKLYYNQIIMLQLVYICLNMKRTYIYSFFYNYILQRIFFNFFVNEILISYLLYSIVTTNAKNLKSINVEELNSYKNAKVSLTFLKKNKFKI